MTAPPSFGAALGAWFKRRTAFLNRPGTAAHCLWLVPLLFGLLSLALGQDANWDLKNYHTYNPYALLHGRIGFDLSPGQWQSYFNPTLDLLYYGLNAALPAPLVGFVMGVLHGLNFLLVLGIARLLLPGLDDADRQRLPLLLAVAGVLGAGFLSGIGNSMGDNMIALFVLLSLYLVLHHWPRWSAWSMASLGWMALAGLVMGLGTGLKLTNATYALALCLALLTLDGNWWQRLRLPLVFGVAVLVGLGISAGHWFLTMWQIYGNPLFPQMNDIFHSPLAAEYGVLDMNHVPRNAAEAALWPFVFTRDFNRVSEIVLRAFIWPALYLLFLALPLKLAAERLRCAAAPPLDRRVRFAMVFFVLGYLVWLKLFGIYRYLVPLELLSPLMAWLLLHRLLRAGLARRASVWLLLLAGVAVFPFTTWGHVRWAAAPFRIADPGLDAPSTALIYTAAANPPMGWMAHLLPGEAPVVSLNGGFPESPGYLARIRAIAASHAGTHYVVLGADPRSAELAPQDRKPIKGWPLLTDSPAACARVESVLKLVHSRLVVEMLPAAPGMASCRVVRRGPDAGQMLMRDRDQQLNEAQALAYNRDQQAKGAQALAAYGVQLRADSCRVLPAYIGAAPFPYQVCVVAEDGGGR